MGRRRVRLVPKDCLEALEIRSVLYFDDDGNPYVDYDVDSQTDVPIHEALGVMFYAALAMVLDHRESAE